MPLSKGDAKPLTVSEAGVGRLLLLSALATEALAVGIAVAVAAVVWRAINGGCL